MPGGSGTVDFFQDFQMKLLINVLFLYLKVDYYEMLVFKPPGSRSLEILLQLLFDNMRTYTVVLVFKSRVFFCLKPGFVRQQINIFYMT